MIAKRHFVRILGSWMFASCFVFLLTLNFYINVWTQTANGTYVPEVTPEDRRRSKSLYLWPRNISNRGIFNTTVKNTLDLPPFFSTNFPQLLTTTKPFVNKRQQIWPSLNTFSNDRILAQMTYKPDWIIERELSGGDRGIPLKKILLHNGFKEWDVKPGQQTFLEQNCPVNTCQLTDSRYDQQSADAVLFRQIPRKTFYRRPPSQIWILYLLESPYFTVNLKKFNGMFNWTATYRRDSDIVTPYEKFVKHEIQPGDGHLKNTINYAEGKTKKVAWFASNCRATNQRLEYAYELSRHIEVDIYGACGKNKCPRGRDACFQMLDKDYKFYLAFENSNCRDYITEKFFFNGLQHDVIPIVMGAAPEDYRRVAPHYSYIHVDEYTSPKQLAEYLHKIDQNDDLFNEYFKWKGSGTFINTYFWCRVCALLHDTEEHAARPYGDIQEWWSGKDVCIGKHRWGQHPRTSPYISDYHSTVHLPV